MTIEQLFAEDCKVHGSTVNTEEDARRHLLEGRELHVITGEQDTMHIAEFFEYTTCNIGNLTHCPRASLKDNVEEFDTLDELVAACRKLAEWRCWHVYCPHE